MSQKKRKLWLFPKKSDNFYVNINFQEFNKEKSKHNRKCNINCYLFRGLLYDFQQNRKCLFFITSHVHCSFGGLFCSMMEGKWTETKGQNIQFECPIVLRYWGINVCKEEGWGNINTIWKCSVMFWQFCFYVYYFFAFILDDWEMIRN